MVLRERHDIVTGESCIPASLNVNNLEAAVLHFPLCGQGCANLGLQINILGKAAELHLALLMSSSHRLLIIHSPKGDRVRGSRVRIWIFLSGKVEGDC
jgi:hypothetical protein